MFQTNRTDGRSMPDVIVELVKDAQPGATFTYQDLIQALDKNSSKHHTILDARGAVARAKSRLLRDHSRTLRNLSGVGYKLAAATEHREIAIVHKTKSDRQLYKGVQTLRHVRWDEMDENARTAHQGQLMVLSALYERQNWVERRMSKIESLIRTISTGKDASPDAA